MKKFERSLKSSIVTIHGNSFKIHIFTLDQITKIRRKKQTEMFKMRDESPISCVIILVFCKEPYESSVCNSFTRSLFVNNNNKDTEGN